MIFMLICTEGEVSEPAFIRALITAVGAQAPAAVSRDVEILPLPLGGNQGHARLIEVADNVVAAYSSDSAVSLAGEGDTVEKWIVVDHDDMERHNVSPEELRSQAEDAGYTLIISKPNFELFVLAAFAGIDKAVTTHKESLKSAINACIESINEDDMSQKGFTREMLMPKYSKKTYVAEKLFGLMLNSHPELVDRLEAMQTNEGGEQYTEMPALVRRIISLYR